MATSLQKQLAVIAATSTHQLDLKAQKLAHGKSLLFEPRVAASQSFENLYLICYEGYRDLCALDPRFVQFSRSLFSEQSKVEDRTQMTQKENEKLNLVLEAFMTMVGPRLLLKPAEKALEWLVRRFRVHEYNTETLVFTYLPYHNTPQFLALLSILPPNPAHALRFLHPYIQSPTNPPRQTIVYTAVNTPAFFDAFQNYVIKVLRSGHQGPSLLSFWSSVTTQAIDGILDHSNSGRRGIQDQKTESFLLRILPVLNVCMRASSGPEAVTACYMMVIVLVTKGEFEDKVLDSLMEAAIRSQETETLSACLMCLAVVAEERSEAHFPSAVAKRLLKITGLSRTLVTLSTQCRVDRLALGSALASLDSIASSEENQNLLRDILASRLLDEAHTSIVLAALLQVVRQSESGSTDHAQLIDYVAKLGEDHTISRILEATAKKNNVDLESLGLALGTSPEDGQNKTLDDEDAEMEDVDGAQTINAPIVLLPAISEVSFLEKNAHESFQTTFAAFQQAVASGQTSRFLSSASLQQGKALETPLYLTFLARIWCSSSPAGPRVTALRSATSLIKASGSSLDLQNLIPYLLFALSDPSAAIRRSATALGAEISAKVNSARSKVTVWGSSQLYGTSSKIPQLSQEQSSGLVSILVPLLEECSMDARFVIASLRDVLEGTKTTKNSLKSTLKSPILAFLGAHATTTPLLAVRLRLLPLFNFTGKASATVRSNSILPTVGKWFSLSNVDATKMCANEQISIADADSQHVAALLPKEVESTNMIKDVVSGNYSKERTELLEAVFGWLNSRWSSMRSESRLSLSQALLDIALNESSSGFDGSCRSYSLETLRNVKLDTTILASFLDSVPTAVQMPEEAPAKKRRRTSRNEMVRADATTPEEVSRLLRRLTLVLELIEGSRPSEHPELFKSLFSILGDLQPLRQQSGSELVYLQGLILGSLTPMVNQIRTQKDSSEYQAFVRADLLVDCIRHSASPQVQNAALLLISSLASWVPEMILHNLMPIFTFIGSTLLRQQDDYSAHVVDQTISRVVPQLATSLRQKQRSFLSGVADLLLSFTAAFEHIPEPRRLKLFAELARTLGPEDALSAILALLVDRYPTSKVQRRFSVELLLVFDPLVTLQTFKGYLDLVEDAAGSKRKVADTLFSLNEKQPGQVETVLTNLLSSLAELAADERLTSHVARAFKRRADTSQPRTLFAAIVETIIRVSKAVTARQQKLYQCCSRVLGRCLNLLPTTDLVKSTELLLANPDHEVQIAAIRAVEIRTSAVVQNDKLSVASLVSFLPNLDKALQNSSNLDVKRIVISCIDSIIGRFGKRDASAVATVAQTVSGPQALSSADDQVRILSLLCLTSVIDVLEDEAISLLPTVLPAACEYLGKAIENGNAGLHNAVFALLTNTVQRLSFMFSREYLIPVLKLSQQSAAGGLEDACDEERTQFYHSVSQNLEPQEVFTAIKATWADAIAQGSEALVEQLQLVQSTIEAKTKSQLVKSSSTLFNLFLEAFKLREAVSGKNEEFDEDDVEQLEDSLVEAVVSMTLKLNDATFRPFFAQLVETSASGSITFYKFLGAFFEKFKSIVTSYSSYILEPASQLLNTLAAQKTNSPLRNAVLSSLKQSFEHDQDSFWQSPSHLSTILSPLLSQLTIPPPIDETNPLTSHTIPAIIALAAALPSATDAHRDMNAILLKYMRSESAHTRFATVQCERALTKKLGEEWLGLLPEMLPFISEAREDDDESVERETARWIADVEEILGESLEGMLS
ncbi:U3 small nucleolar RNA-associated protein 10 [Periconia macrospinosa]|uniref:U3 small nucleolar RNA-associated protein 10 n=1 Tax=Periconia macrospinosa TaxID=97972 RepID=A0A2V1DHS1_9PLEO|nr:U3 small nucleolar RNA-associated protein 10 [Periconia macrospinosa]